MKHTLIFSCALLVALSAISSGTTVTWSGAPTSRLPVDAGLVALPTGSLVLAGTFANEAAVAFNPLISVSANMVAISNAAGWKQFGLDPITGTPDILTSNTLGINASGPGAGKVGGSVGDQNAPQADFFNGKFAYLWIFNAVTVSSATQMGIFRATTATPSWVFPTNAGGLGDGVTFGTVASGTNVIVAVGGAGSVDAGGSNGRMILAATVPEPCTLALFGITGAGFLSARRRKRK